MVHFLETQIKNIKGLFRQTLILLSIFLSILSLKAYGADCPTSGIFGGADCCGSFAPSCPPGKTAISGGSCPMSGGTSGTYWKCDGFASGSSGSGGAGAGGGMPVSAGTGPGGGGVLGVSGGTGSPTPFQTPSKRLDMSGGYYNHQGHRGNDQCGISAKIDGGYACDSTYTTVQMATMSNMLSQTAGSAATMAMGQSAQMRAYQTGTQESALRSAGTTQENTGKMQMGMGGLNAAVGAYQIFKAMKHRKDGNNIASEANGGGLKVEKADATGSNAISNEAMTQGDAGWISGTGLNGKIVSKFKMNEESGANFTEVNGATPQERQAQIAARDAQGEKLKNVIAGRIRDIASDAQSEQKAAAAAAMGGGMMSLMTGTQQMMSGTFSMMAGKQLQKAADALANKQTNPAPAILSPTLPSNITANGQSIAAPGAITGNGQTDQNQAEASDDSGGAAPPDLGGAFNPNPLPSGLTGGNTPGKYNSGVAQNPSGGGAGGIGAGGSTTAAQGGPEDPQAKLAPKGEGDKYESGGGAFMSGGGGGGKGADGGPDLSGLLDKFLPKKDEANQPANSILEFGERGNGQDAPLSALGRNANLFTEVSKTYMEKTSRGEVGP